MKVSWREGVRYFCFAAVNYAIVYLHCTMMPAFYCCYITLCFTHPWRHNRSKICDHDIELINKSVPDQNGPHFALDIFKCASFNEILCIEIQISFHNIRHLLSKMIVSRCYFRRSLTSSIIIISDIHIRTMYASMTISCYIVCQIENKSTSVLVIVRNSTDLPTHSSPPNAAYMRQWIESILVQIMARRLFGHKPLPKPMLGCCQLDP